MIWFILAVILLLIGVGMIAVALANGGDGAGFGFIPIIVAALLMIPACLYSLDVGEVAVIRNMGGSRRRPCGERGLPCEGAVAVGHQIRYAQQPHQLLQGHRLQVRRRQRGRQGGHGQRP